MTRKVAGARLRRRNGAARSPFIFPPRPWRRRESTRSPALRANRSMSPSWPGGRKVAVSFALFVEEFGFGQGPVFRPDLATRNPDLVNEAFRQYGIDWGVARVGRLFRELDVPLTIVLNAEFPGNYASVWKEFRASQPNAPIIAHGMNNTSRMLPLGRGLAEQKAYIRQTLDMIAGATGVRPAGWSSPSVYSERRHHAGGGRRGHHLHPRPDGFRHHFAPEDAGRAAGPAALSGRHGRHGPAAGADENARARSRRSGWTTCWSWPNEARADPSREATTVVIGIHPFVVGTPDGAAALRRVLSAPQDG